MLRVILLVTACLSYCCWQADAGQHCGAEAVNDGNTPSLDVVYTYVNGNDEKFLKDKASHEDGENDATDQKNKATRTSDAINSRRFTDHDELRMSIRSVLKNMQWVRCIYIVIADYEKQVPQWFNKNQPRVKMVRHKEIFQDPEALPTYNSHAIEANLYHIKGLARFFLYMNDDFYINAPVTISDFVDIKSLRVKPSFKSTKIDQRESPEVRKMAYTAANINNQNLLKKLGILKQKSHYLAHVGYIQDKSVWEKIMKISEVAEHQKETSKRRFRNNQDLWFPGLTTLYDHAQDGSRESSLKPCYIETKHEDVLKTRIHKCIVDEKTRGKYQMLCINDVLDDDQQQSYKLIQSTLQKTWPMRAISEKNDYHPDGSPERADPDERADEENEDDLLELDSDDEDTKSHAKKGDEHADEENEDDLQDNKSKGNNVKSKHVKKEDDSDPTNEENDESHSDVDTDAIKKKKDGAGPRKKTEHGTGQTEDDTDRGKHTKADTEPRTKAKEGIEDDADPRRHVQDDADWKKKTNEDSGPKQNKNKHADPKKNTNQDADPKKNKNKHADPKKNKNKHADPKKNTNQDADPKQNKNKNKPADPKKNTNQDADPTENIFEGTDSGENTIEGTDSRESTAENTNLRLGTRSQVANLLRKIKDAAKDETTVRDGPSFFVAQDFPGDHESLRTRDDDQQALKP